ncbi:Helix-turn-helix domain-containing protein [Pseudonocardia thermophila]|uniref:Helix-turn-helix domain-containing protein n=1 Tax=Pseudonocardia thermophila TaxID=1848 RepID=A0A1M7AV90_PSETH|nr:helix-turn-helix domain-containing protein [Pseudonocardia thermophila]SHL46591.1 Helix-turn-helix domain-containing protein [Pseudonocardia thermophila]
MANWLTTADVAARAHRDPCTIRRAAVAGELHGHQPMRNGKPLAGGRWTFAEAAVDAWIQGLDLAVQRERCGCVQLRLVRRAS